VSFSLCYCLSVVCLFLVFGCISGSFCLSHHVCDYLCVHVSLNESVNCSVVSDTLQPHGFQPTKLPCPWYFPGKNIEVSCHFLLQSIFSTQRWKLHLLPFLLGRWIIYYRATWEVPHPHPATAHTVKSLLHT